MPSPTGLLKWIGRPVKELIEEGYPESVAKRISSGELSMDPEDVARRMEMGYDTANPMFHSGDKGLTEIDASRPFFMSSSPEMSAGYLRKDGEMYKMLIAKDAKMGEVDAGGLSWGNLEDRPYITATGEVYNTSDFFPTDNPYGPDVTTNDLVKISKQLGESGLYMDDISDFGPNYPAIRDMFKKTHGKDARVSELIDEFTARNAAINDPTKVRSIKAAFDPEYTGSNILGSRMAPTAAAGLLGILGLTEEDLK